MNILVVNGNPAGGTVEFDSALGLLGGRLIHAGHQVTVLTLRELQISQCVGCFSCWLKTPGSCIFRDDQDEILRQYLGAGLVVFASPLIMGFTSALLKRCCDRIVPVLLPYIDVSSGECRHWLRYGRAPRFAVLYVPEADTDAQDVEIVASLWRRLARNAGSEVEVFAPLHENLEEVCHALGRA